MDGSGMEIFNAISMVGFPVVACSVMFYFYDKTLNSVVITLKELTDVIKEIKGDMDKCKELRNGV